MEIRGDLSDDHSSFEASTCPAFFVSKTMRSPPCSGLQRIAAGRSLYSAAGRDRLSPLAKPAPRDCEVIATHGTTSTPAAAGPPVRDAGVAAYVRDWGSPLPGAG